MDKDFDWLEEWCKNLLYAGISFNEIYELDVYEASLIIKNHEEQEKAKMKNIITLAYNTGAFVSSMSYGKNKTPPLESYLEKIDRAYSGQQETVDKEAFEDKKRAFRALREKLKRKGVKNG